MEKVKITLKHALSFLSLPSGSVGQKTRVPRKHSSQPSSRISWMRRKVSLQASTCRKRWQVIPQRNLRNDASKMTSCWCLLICVASLCDGQGMSSFVKMTTLHPPWSGEADPSLSLAFQKRYHAEMEQNPQILIETKHLCIFRSEFLDAENPCQKFWVKQNCFAKIRPLSSLHLDEFRQPSTKELETKGAIAQNLRGSMIHSGQVVINKLRSSLNSHCEIGISMYIYIYMWKPIISRCDDPWMN